MGSRVVALLVLLLALPASAQFEGSLPVSEKGPQTAIQKAIDAAACTGEFADALLALTPRAREFDRMPEANYSYCLRNTATYECLYYGPDAKTKKRTLVVSSHGTAFAYRERAGDYFLLTNEHAATWPAVTDDDHKVSGVPYGCKKVDEKLRLVRDESDDYEPGHIVVSKIASDPQMDAAILKTRQKLNLMPYRVGRSALLKAGNVVQVRGFPLGLMQAMNYGKIVSAYDRDRQRDWDHVDFVMDALVTKGNSGSPVLAVSCRTGELELVGLYHAGYKGSPALNVVVGIDQLRDFMETFKRKPVASEEDDRRQTVTREQLVAALSRPELVPFFKIGERFARARLDPDGSITWDVFSDAFPARDTVSVSLRDVAGEGAGSLASFALDMGEGKLRWVPVSAANAESQELARKLLTLVRLQLMRTVDYREAAPTAKSSRDAFKHVAELAKALERQKGDGAELLKAMADLAERLPPPEGTIAGAIQGMEATEPVEAPPGAGEASPKAPGAPAPAIPAPGAASPQPVPVQVPEKSGQAREGASK